MNKHPKRSRAKVKRTLKKSDFFRVEESREVGVFRGRFGRELKNHILKHLIPLSDGRCKMCNCMMNNRINSPRKRTIDHIIPHSRGGKTTVENCQLVCLECNEKKASTVCFVLEEWK